MSDRELIPMTSARAAAAKLDAFLADPRQAGTPFSYQEIVACEELGELPAGAVDLVRQFGFQEYLVPAALGGRFRSLEELYWVTRIVSQRNLTIAVMFGSALLGANPVWLWGAPEQKAQLAAELLDGRLICFAVSEADHGSDLLATETVARRDGAELALSGVKWPVGNATRARFVTTFARMGAQAKFSLLLVDKEKLDPGCWQNLPFVKTVGLRGHDLSGIAYEGARIPASAVIGQPGTGLVQTLKALQITRTAIAALSVGTMDSALRIALDYTQERNLYGQPVYRLPVIRDHLLKGHLDLLIAECVVTPAARCLTLAPGRLSLWSSLVKYFVPVLADEVVASMGTVLGARGYLREGVADGVFQKLQRDHSIASIFEGTTHVNLHNIASQLPFVLARADRPAEPADQDLLDRLFSLTQDPPVWEPDGRRLQLTNVGRDEITAAWEGIAGRLVAIAAASPCALVDDLLGLVEEFSVLRGRRYASGLGATAWDSSSLQAMETAKAHTVFHAAACCLLTWLTNRDTLGGAFAEGRWVAACLERLLQRLEPERVLTASHLAAVEDAVLGAARNGELFTVAAFGETWAGQPLSATATVTVAQE